MLKSKILKPMLWRRIGAFFLDYLIVYLPYLLILTFVSIFGVSQLIDSDAIRQYGQLVGFFTVTLPITLYNVIGEHTYGKTIGKHLMTLHVTTAEKTLPSFPQALLRNALKFIPWELAHGIIWYTLSDQETIWLIPIIGNVIVYGILIYYGIALMVSASDQTPYDSWAGLYVQEEADEQHL